MFTEIYTHLYIVSFVHTLCKWVFEITFDPYPLLIMWFRDSILSYKNVKSTIFIFNCIHVVTCGIYPIDFALPTELDGYFYVWIQLYVHICFFSCWFKFVTLCCEELWTFEWCFIHVPPLNTSLVTLMINNKTIQMPLFCKISLKVKVLLWRLLTFIPSQNRVICYFWNYPPFSWLNIVRPATFEQLQISPKSSEWEFIFHIWNFINLRLKLVLWGLHFPLPSMNRLNQTKKFCCFGLSLGLVFFLFYLYFGDIDWCI